MKVIKFWFKIAIILQFISISFGAHLEIHSQIMSAIRNGNVELLRRAIQRRPYCLRKFKPGYFSMAFRMWSKSPDSEDRKSIATILSNELEDENEKWEDLTPLICAVIYGDRGTLNEIIRVANINGRNTEGMTAFMMAVKYGLLEMVENLIIRGAKKNIFDEREWSAIHYACELENDEIREELIKLLLRNNTNVFLMKWPYAIKFDRIDICKVFFDNTIEESALNADEMLVRKLKVELEVIVLSILAAIMFSIVPISIKWEVDLGGNTIEYVGLVFTLWSLVMILKITRKMEDLKNDY